MNSYLVGSKIKIISGGKGALGSNGHTGTVMPSEYPSKNGLLRSDVGIVVKLDREGCVWKVNKPENGGVYELIQNNYSVDLI